MSQQGPLRDYAGGGGQIMTLSSEGGPPTPPAGNNFNFSGSIAGGSAANGAIEFITPGGPGAATNGQMDAVVRTDGVTIHINASNDLEVIGGTFAEEFTVDAFTPPGTNPVVPTVSGNVTVTGGQVAAGVVGTNVIRTDSLAANTYTIEIQRSQAVAVSTLADNGVSHFDSDAFDVDANGFVQLNGGGVAITSVDVDASTPPGTDPVVPDSTGKITVTGGQVAAGTTTNVIRTDSLAANTYTIEVQRSQAVASSTIGDNGVSHFNSARFTVDANGFVDINGAGVGETITGNTGGPLSPTAGNWNIFGASVAAGTTPVATAGAVSTLTVNVQRSQAIASTNATNVGLAAFDSAAFDVDANGFVQLNGGGIAITSINVDANTPPGTDPVVPNASGQITITGGQVATGTIGANVIRTDSLAANTFTIEIQRSTAVSATDSTKNGVSHFDSTSFTVDTNGFVQSNGGGFTWTDVSGAFSPLKNNGYFITGTATGTLPAAPSQGDTIKFFVDHASQVLTIDAPGTQIIRLGSLVSSAGGTATSTLQGDSVELVYRSANTCWEAVCGFSGTWLMA